MPVLSTVTGLDVWASSFPENCVVVADPMLADTLDGNEEPGTNDNVTIGAVLKGSGNGTVKDACPKSNSSPAPLTLPACGGFARLVKPTVPAPSCVEVIAPAAILAVCTAPV